MVANVGCSQVVCRTKNGSYLKLSNQHTTKNENEVKRIIKMGGKIYQTIVNVPFQ
jgi:serine/threonine protein phosphatase PrpC